MNRLVVLHSQQPQRNQMTYTLHHGNCLDIMPTLEAGSVDMVLTDPPYGTTACKWDSVLPFAPMWAGIKHAVKRNAAIVMTASQPFTSALVMSNVGMFKYEWIWEKNQPSGIASARFQPMKNHENVLVFCEGKTTYNKQPTKSKIVDRKLGKSNGKFWDKTNVGVTGMKPKKTSNPDNVLLANVNPRTIIPFKIPPNAKGKLHPTQKPVALMEYLIKTYTNEGDTVLDFTMGSGTTGVACANTGRKFIGIELDAGYFDIASRRVAEAYAAQPNATDQRPEGSD